MTEVAEAGMSGGGLAGDLARQGFAVEETHISWVFLDAQRAYKVKKPVDFGFLDFTSLEKRRQACEKELELNRHLAPGVYLGLLPVTWNAAEGHRLDGAGETVDWAVAMVRLSAADRGDARLQAGLLEPAHLDILAARLAAFHAAARHDAWTAGFGEPVAIRANVAGNLGEARPAMRAALGNDAAAALEAGQLARLAALEPLFRERMAKGRVRDGHGDLRLSQMYFDDAGEVRILDRIEFNDAFRYADVAADVAFLSMDLAARGRRDLAERFLAAYARAADDYDLYGLVDFYAGYRACVRGKVAAYALTIRGSPEPVRAAAAAKAARHFRFALETVAGPARGAPLILFGGGIATGKSTLAEALGRRLAVPVLSSDRTRKHLAGLDPLAPVADPLWSGLYAPENTAALYAELRRRARILLASGRPAIVDASFRSAGERDAFRDMAGELGSPFRFCECRASEALVAERLRQRSLAPSVSDGRAAIAEGFRSAWEAGSGQDEEGYQVLDTSAPMADVLARVLAGLPDFPWAGEA